MTISSDAVPGQPVNDRSRNSSGGLPGLLLGIALLTLAGIAARPLFQPPASSEPWRVRVVAPRTNGLAPGVTDNRRQLLEVAVLDALERQLAGRRQLLLVAPFEPLDSPPTGDRLELLAVDEVVTIVIDCGRRSCLGRLRRSRTTDGSSVDQGPRILLDSDDPRLIDGRLAVVVDAAFRDFPRHPAAARLHAEAKDYETYLDQRLRWLRTDERAGDVVAGGLERSLERLARVRGGSPRLFETYVLESHLRLTADLDRAGTIELLEHARRIAPIDYRAVSLLVPLLIAEQRHTDATEALRRIAELLPGDRQIAIWQQQVDHPNVE